VEKKQIPDIIGVLYFLLHNVHLEPSGSIWSEIFFLFLLHDGDLYRGLTIDILLQSTMLVQ
jgi:hypothetical protein